MKILQKGEKPDDIWIELGKKSFARFFNLEIDEVSKMEANPNDVFYDMLLEMSNSLNEYEDFMVKIRKMKAKEQLSRLEFLDL